MVDIVKIKKALLIEPYTSLYDLANTASQKRTDTPDVVAKPTDDSANTQQQGLIPADAKPLAYDISSLLDSTYRQRGRRLNLSMRQLSKAKEELVSKELAIEVWIGKTLFLAPTEKLYKHLELLSPYKRNVSIEHSFLTLVAKSLIEADSAVQKMGIEVPIGDSGSTVDLVAYLKNGQRQAYEITLSSSNVSQNAAKLRNKGFSKITFICRDDQLKQSVSKILRDAGFEPDFFSTIECTIFSALMRKRKTSDRRTI